MEAVEIVRAVDRFKKDVNLGYVRVEDDAVGYGEFAFFFSDGNRIVTMMASKFFTVFGLLVYRLVAVQTTTRHNLHLLGLSYRLHITFKYCSAIH